MSRSASVVLGVQPFLAVVKGQEGKDAERTLISAYVAQPFDIPDIESGEVRQLKFFLPNALVDDLAQPRSLLYCHDAEVYLQDTQHGLLVKNATLIGSLAEPEGKKAPRIEKLPFSREDLDNYKVAVWQIPPK